MTTYRDDDDALWHRAHSLQRELDSTQAELVSSRQQVEAIDAERRRLAARVGELPNPNAPPKTRWVVVVLVAAAVAVPAIVIASRGFDRERPRATSHAAPPRCKIDSAPSGADVVCVMRIDAGSEYRELNRGDPDVEVVWGHTPYSKSSDFLFGRGLCDQVVLRLPGYLDVPIEQSKCGQTIALVPEN